MALVNRAAGSLWLTLLICLVLGGAAVALGVVLFDLTIGGGLALYFVTWWILLFAVLPFGARSQAEAGEVAQGSDPGAPSAPQLREKAIWTTLVSGVVFCAVAGLLPLAGL